LAAFVGGLEIKFSRIVWHFLLLPPDDKGQHWRGCTAVLPDSFAAFIMTCGTNVRYWGKADIKF
jgi:hypothetical protein